MNLPFLRRRPTPADLAATLPPVQPRPPLPQRVPQPAVVVEAPEPPRPGVRATYRAVFDRAGIPPLIVHQVTRGELAAELTASATPYLGVVLAVVDADLPHVLIRRGGLTVATATLTTLPTTGGAHV